MAQKIPSIRFLGFTEPWEQRKFGDLYHPTSEKNDLTFGRDRIISVANMHFSTEVYVTDDDYLRTYNVMRLGDIAFEGNRSGRFAHGRFVENTIGDGIVSHVFKVFRPRTDYDLNYWKYAIHNEATMKDALTRATKASTMMHELVSADFLEQTTYAPSLPEQRQIGALFARLDSLITLHQREHDRLIDVRTSLMQKMFPGPGEDTPQIRFSEFSVAWRVHKLGDLVTRYDHRVPTPNDGYTRLGVRSFARGTFLEKVPADQAIGETELHEVGANNLIVNIVFAWEQAIAITSEPDTVALVSHRFPQFSFNEGQCPAFYRYALLDPRFKHHLWLASPSGAGRNKTLRIDEMLDYEILVPDESEQRAIARFFKNLDQSIEARRCECDALVHAKSALLQKMFV